MPINRSICLIQIYQFLIPVCNDITHQIFNIVALTLGSILLIASTACATIVFNAILAPIFLKEKFKIFPDGCTVVLLSIGSTLAAFQEP